MVGYFKIRVVTQKVTPIGVTFLVKRQPGLKDGHSGHKRLALRLELWFRVRRMRSAAWDADFEIATAAGAASQ